MRNNLPIWGGGPRVGFASNFTSGPVICTIDRDGRRDKVLFTFKDAARITLAGRVSWPIILARSLRSRVLRLLFNKKNRIELRRTPNID